MSLRRLLNRLCLLLGLLPVGCVTHLQPTVPMGAQSGDLSLQLKMLKASTGRTFVLETHSQVQHTIRQGWLTVPTRAPCSGGESMDEVEVDGLEMTEAVLPPGVHELHARFLTHQSDFRLDVVLDLRLADGACVRSPVISQSLPLEVPSRPLLTFSTDVNGDSDLSGLRAVVGLQVGAAAWVGRFLLGGDVGAGMAMCNTETCGRTSDDNLRTSFTFPLQANASYRIGDVQRDLLFSTFLVGLRYSFFPISLPALGGERRFLVHGSYATFTWAFADPIRGPFLHQERRPLYQLVIPVGVLWEPDGQKAGFTGGMSVRVLLPL